MTFRLCVLQRLVPRMRANLAVLSSSSSHLRSLAEAVGHAKFCEIKALACETVPYRFRDDERPRRDEMVPSHRSSTHGERDWIKPISSLREPPSRMPTWSVPPLGKRPR